jgi:hypothetical protein
LPPRESCTSLRLPPHGLDRSGVDNSSQDECGHDGTNDAPSSRLHPRLLSGELDHAPANTNKPSDEEEVVIGKDGILGERRELDG